VKLSQKEIFSMNCPDFSMGKENVSDTDFQKKKTGQNILPSKDIRPV